MKCNPVLVEVHRGQVVESVHRGCAIAVSDNGDTLFSVGDVNRAVYPRSALKLVQAIPLLESGAADAYELSSAEIALACASHNAEEIHTRSVSQWLHRLDLDVDDLECGATLPLMEQAAHRLIASGETPTRVHQNCSGKHTGMLTLARFLNTPTTGYSEYGHPAQQAWMQCLSELIDIDVFSLPWERDGCGLPAICMPLNQLAQAYACFANTSRIGGRRATAMDRILSSLKEFPMMLAGTNRCCTEVIDATGGSIVVKTGAEGVYGGVIPGQGIGFALKVDDGAGRASEVALGELLKHLDAAGDITPAAAGRLEKFFQPQITNSQGHVTGKILASQNWLSG